MARNSFNFQAVLKLRTDDFKKGVRDVQRSINGLKQSFLNFAGALGVTLSLGKFVSMMKDTAVKLDTAKNVLKNVSENTREFGENLAYLHKISDKYGQDLIVLINNFGQFRAAAKSSALDIDDLRYVYEALTRAAGAYHMSADRTNDMMVAVTQMFSKGKIAAEELRRQLGNSLPGAFNIMAKAAQMAGITTNGTTGELEEMMRKGQVLADQVMPAFAKLLNEITEHSNFNSLQQSLNRLKNTWTLFVERSNFDKFYEGLVNGTNGFFNFILQRLNLIKAALAGVATYIGLWLGKKVWAKAGAGIEKWRIQTKAALESTEKQVESTKNALYQLAEAEVKAAEKAAKGRAKAGFPGSSVDEAKYRSKLIENNKKGITAKQLGIPNGRWIDSNNYKKAAAAAKEYNEALIAQSEALRLSGQKALLTRREIRNLRVENELFAQIGASTGDIYVKSLSKIGIAFKKLGQSIGAFLKANWVLILISALVSLYSYIRKANKEAAELANTVNEITAKYKTGNEDAIADSESVKQLKAYKDILAGTTKGSDVWKATIQEINNYMGATGDKAIDIDDSLEDINKKVNGWLRDLKQIAKVQNIINDKNELYGKNAQLNERNAVIRGNKNNYKKRGANPQYQDSTQLKGAVFGEGGRYGWGPKKEIHDNEEAIKQNTAAIDSLNVILNNMSAEDPSNVVNALTGQNPGGGNTNSGDTHERTRFDDVKDVFDAYDQKARELKNQLEAGAITIGEYNEELDDLIKGTYKSAAAFGDLDKYLAGFNPAAVGKLKDRLNNLGKEFGNVISKQFDEIDETVDEEMRDLAKEMYESAHDQLEKDIEKNKIYKNVYKAPAPRDTSFDYKKSDADIINEENERLKQWEATVAEAIKRLEELGETGSAEFATLLAWFKKLQEGTSDFAKLAKLAEWKKDIEDLSKAYQDRLYTSIRDVSNSFERLYNVYKDFAEAFGAEIDPDGNFQKILTVFGALFETFETIYSIVKSLSALSEASAALEKAKNDEKMKALEQEIGLTTALGAAEVAAAGEATAAATTEAIAKKALAEANKEAAAAAAIENAMAVPYPYNLAALTSNIAAITAAYAAMKGLSAFAKGGIVGGNSTTGDKNVIRANSGEMILTKAQQGTLFNMLNGKGGLGGGNVEFKIRGTDLVGTLNNYNQKRRG